MKPPFIIQNLTIYSDTAKYKNGYIKVNGDKIEEIGTMQDLDQQNENHYQIIHPPSGCQLIPGMIDVHIHGASGADVMDGTVEAIQTIATSLPKEGTTSFLATTLTQPDEKIEKVLTNVSSFIQNKQLDAAAEVLGIHLEGPFISELKAGAQPSQYIKNADIELFKKWQHLANNTIKLVTIAPEVSGGYELIHYLKETGVIPSIGHSNAIYDEVKLAILSGATQVTHLFNGMRGLHHREVGVAGAALLQDELFVEIIADGIHVSPQMVELTYRQKTDKKIILITDSMRAKCLKNGIYDLGGQEVTVENETARLKDGTLAGSILKLNDALKNMKEYTQCTVEEMIQMACINPAKQLRLFHKKGSIAVGKDADLVVINEGLDVVMTFCRGKLAYQKEG